ncbi:MAG TPA: hypothetical protein VK306_00955 [Acidimicrobiales bacterium]|nr:hypothetical protein [Acidimicrobiales bacterium]
MDPDACPDAGTMGCRAVDPPAAEVDGDGCPDAVTIDGREVAAAGAHWTLGQPGDLAAVGDWDCDGDSSPALLRPASGAVFVFPGWAPADRPVTVEPAGAVPGGTALRARPTAGGCHELVVERAGGDAVVVAVEPT